MKLNSNFVTREMAGEQIIVAVGGSDFSGMIRANPTAAFIIESLEDETTEEKIVEAMCGKYDAPKELIAQSVQKILEQLRSIGAIDEN
ncbi:MAG: PqqD family protein [Oscillospiraceae bacterium]|nr:PqqD family protein [Oscillospiraceae bacterium]